ncbi:MAG: Rrf2 family transcriptional regulator [Oligoflexia bacterium]|nr:Rrf2 family transcriptional regulator [Oligoflexia bacterium]
MEIINKSTQYALKAIFSINNSEYANLSLREISTQISVPPTFLRKVLQKLGASGIIEASSGPNGGYKIKKDLSKITLYEIHKIIQGELTLNRCFINDDFPNSFPKNKCPLLKKFSKIQTDLNDALKSLTLAEIAKLYKNHFSK